MSLWPLLILLSIITFVALIFSGRKKNSGSDIDEEVEKTEAHFGLQLKEIEKDLKSGKLNEQDAGVIKAELARELLRHRAVSDNIIKSKQKNWLSYALGGTSVVAIGAAFWVYTLLGLPDQSVLVSAADLTQIQARTPEQIEIDADFARLLQQVEQQMLVDPSDIRGWQVLGPAYVRAGRFDEAVNAYRKINELEPASADNQTDLAEALLMASNGQESAEVMALLTNATSLDPTHARSRFYLAAESTRIEDWDQAISKWEELLALAEGDEPWVASAQNGLAIAMARGEDLLPTQPSNPSPNEQPPALSNPEQAELIANMVAGLDERLNENGGTIDEWTRLVRSYIVMGDVERAKQNYQRAKEAFPDETERLGLDALAAQAGF